MEQAIGHSIERGIRGFVYVFCMGVWAIIGFLYWIPLLARSCGAYSGAVILAIIGRGTPNTKAVKLLDVAANFYSKGFRDIRTSVFSDMEHTEETTGESQSASIFSSWDEFFRVLGVVGTETAIAVLFWGAIVFLVAHIIDV